MSIEDVIHAWKADKDEQDRQDTASMTNPVGEELSDQDLQEIVGGWLCSAVDSYCFLSGNF